MAKKLTKKEAAARKELYAENRRIRAEERRIDAAKAARKLKRDAKKKATVAETILDGNLTVEGVVSILNDLGVDVSVGVKSTASPVKEFDNAEAVDAYFGSEPDTTQTERSEAYSRQWKIYDGLANIAQQDTKRGFVIFDLDGCVADDAWRHQFVVSRENNDDTFHHYHSASVNDKPLQPGRELVRSCVLSGMVVIFITARPEAYRDISQQWIGEHILNHDGGPINLTGNACLLMRANDDARGTVPVKYELLSEVVRDIGAHRIVCGYDDRLDVVTMYKEAFGINGFVLDAYGVSDPLGNVAANMACIAPKPDGETILSTEEVSALVDDDKGDYTGYDDGDVADDLPKKVNYADVPGRLRDSAHLVEGFLKQYGNASIKAGDVMSVLFPRGVTANNAADFRMLSSVTDLVAHLTNLVNSRLLDPNSAHGIAANAAMIESEIMTAEKGALVLGL